MDMNKKDNVYEDTTLTGEVKVEKVDATEGAQVKNASAVLGKFRNVDALAQAYNALQAEFTRRSQRLKELERERENLKAGIESAAHLGVEKLRKNAMARKANEQRFDAFVADVFADNNADKHAEMDVEMNVEMNVETDAEIDVQKVAERPLDVCVQTSERESEKEGTLEKDEPAKALKKDELAGEELTFDFNGRKVSGVAFDSTTDKFIDKDDLKVTIAGVVSNIPETNYGTELVARTYVKFKCDGKEEIVYGNAETSSINLSAQAIRNSESYEYLTENQKSLLETMLP